MSTPNVKKEMAADPQAESKELLLKLLWAVRATLLSLVKKEQSRQSAFSNLSASSPNLYDEWPRYRHKSRDWTHVSAAQLTIFDVHVPYFGMGVLRLHIFGVSRCR